MKCSYQLTTLRPSISFRSAPETPVASHSDGEKNCAETGDSSESGSVVSPLRVFSGRGVVRPGLVPHRSFNSYFRPAPVVRRRCTLPPPPRSPVTAEQSPEQPSPSAEQQPTPTDSVSFSPHRIYRKQVEMCSSKWTPSTRGVPRSPTLSGGGRGGSGLATRSRSVYGHVTSGAGLVPPVSLGRRNTVVGGGTVEHQSPPVTLSLREIYRLSRHGSLHGRRNVLHSRRRSTLSMLRSEKDGAWTSSKASVGVARCESGRGQRASVGGGVPGDGDGDNAAAVDVRRRRSCTDSVQQKQRLARSKSSDSDQLHHSPDSLHSPGNQDSTVRDAITGISFHNYSCCHILTNNDLYNTSNNIHVHVQTEIFSKYTTSIETATWR